ncbi:MAG: hypothetical protein OEW97_06180, partial [Gammaproteobacteria bacterium]|nr:hypothetical protein [Gammaproteobacteria bacterium]
LTNSIFAADKHADVTTQRQNLQIEYVNQLIGISGLKKASPYDHLSKAAAMYQLNQINKTYKAKMFNSTATKVHRDYVNQLINDAFKAKR